MFNFYPPGFVTFAEDIETEHWLEIGEAMGEINTYRNIRIRLCNAL